MMQKESAAVVRSCQIPLHPPALSVPPFGRRLLLVENWATGLLLPETQMSQMYQPLALPAQRSTGLQIPDSPGRA